MNKTITIPSFIVLCVMLFASCSRTPVPAFTRAKTDRHHAYHKVKQDVPSETLAQADTLETTEATLPELGTEANAEQDKSEQAGQKTELQQRTHAISDQLKNIDRSQLSKKQQRLLTKLDKRLQKLENSPSATQGGKGAITTGLVLILAGLILLILGRILFIFGIFGIVFVVLGLIFLLVGIIQAADD